MSLILVYFSSAGRHFGHWVRQGNTTLSHWWSVSTGSKSCAVQWDSLGRRTRAWQVRGACWSRRLCRYKSRVSSSRTIFDWNFRWSLTRLDCFCKNASVATSILCCSLPKVPLWLRISTKNRIVWSIKPSATWMRCYCFWKRLALLSYKATSFQA